MKSVQNRIDQSVNSLVKNWKDHTSRFPVFAAEQLKSALVKKLSAEYADVEPRLVYQAVNEANALASLTIVPLLVLPTLAEEKVQKAAAWAAHQRFVQGADFAACAA
jgi:hypothetical protein